MFEFRPKAFVMILVALLASVANARAEERWLVFYPTTGELFLGLDNEWQQSGGSETFRRNEYEQRLNLMFGGYSLDPRIFNFNLNLEPTFTQVNLDSASGAEDTRTKNLNYGGRFSLLHGTPASPVSLNGNFLRSDDDLNGDFGTRRDVVTTFYGTDLNWKLRALPSTLSYLEQSLDETFFAPSSVPVQRSELWRTVRYRAKNSKMEVLLEGIDYNDQIDPTLDYQSGEGRLNNYFRWGKGSNYTSQLRFYSREGFNPYDRTNIDQYLRLQHMEDLYSTYSYRHERLDRNVDTVTNQGDFELNHQLYENLTTSFKLHAANTRADQYRDDNYLGTIDFFYRKDFEPNLKFRANLGGGYRYSDRTGGALDQTESHVVPVTGIVLLDRRYIIWSTIFVTAPGCNPCTDGLDYLVEDAGGDRTQLRIPAGSRINIGDTINVDYTYEPPTAKYDGIPYRVGIRFDYGWAAFYHRTGGETQNFISGPDPDAVGDQRTDTTGIELEWSPNTTRLAASAERRYTMMPDWETTEYIFRESAFYTVAPNLSLSGSLSQSFLFDGSEVTVYTADLLANWYPVRGLWVSPYLSGFYRATEPSSLERLVETGLNVRWNWRRLGFEMRYSHKDHDTDNDVRIDDRLIMNIRRRF